ncbi:MAG TPA: hypothetical protein VJU82_15840 [Acidobacteriaceae bacterium]|nr:hypothetical protein [Acidobacteriaceae bacterium]
MAAVTASPESESDAGDDVGDRAGIRHRTGTSSAEASGHQQSLGKRRVTPESASLREFRSSHIIDYAS